MALTKKQRRFADEYLIDLNATQAAIRAGYSEKTAGSIGQENLKKPEIKIYIEEQLERLHNERTADAQEVIEYLTSVLRGESEGEELVNEFEGDGISHAARVTKKPSEKDKLRAAELLGKRFGIFTDKIDCSVKVSDKLADVFAQIGGEGLEE